MQKKNFVKLVEQEKLPNVACINRVLLSIKILKIVAQFAD